MSRSLPTSLWADRPRQTPPSAVSASRVLRSRQARSSARFPLIRQSTTRADLRAPCPPTVSIGSDVPESPHWRDLVVLGSASTPQAASTPVPEEPSPTLTCPSERRRRAEAEADFAA
eukprot:10873213-Alexandrium_andersonii.AAC.1